MQQEGDVLKQCSQKHLIPNYFILTSGSYAIVEWIEYCEIISTRSNHVATRYLMPYLVPAIKNDDR